MNRRGFLKAAAITPVAAPVAMREAAASAGLSAPLTALRSYSVDDDDCVADISETTTADKNWLTDRVKRSFAKEHLEEQRKEYKYMRITVLDPDLACSRSFSMSTALRIQRERNIQREIEREQERALTQYRRMFGIPFDMSKLKSLLGE